MEQTKTSVKAIWSLVLGLLSLMCLCFLTGIPAVILGHLALREIRRSGGRVAGDGMAIVGLVIGYLSIAVSILMLVLFIVFIPRGVAPTPEETKAESEKSTCLDGQRQVYAAVEQWSMVESKNEGDPTDETGVLKYIKGGELPECPVNNIPIAIPAKVGESVKCPDPAVEGDHAMAW